MKVICIKEFAGENEEYYNESFKINDYYDIDINLEFETPKYINILDHNNKSYSFRLNSFIKIGIPYPIFEDHFEYEIKKKLNILLDMIHK